MEYQSNNYISFFWVKSLVKSKNEVTLYEGYTGSREGSGQDKWTKSCQKFSTTNHILPNGSIDSMSVQDKGQLKEDSECKDVG